MEPSLRCLAGCLVAALHSTYEASDNWIHSLIRNGLTLSRCPGIRIGQFGRRSIWFPSALSEVEENSAPVVFAFGGLTGHCVIYQCTDPFSHIQPHPAHPVCLGSSPSSGTNSEPHRHLPDGTCNACMWLRQTIESKIDRESQVSQGVKCKVMHSTSLDYIPPWFVLHLKHGIGRGPLQFQFNSIGP